MIDTATKAFTTYYNNTRMIGNREQRAEWTGFYSYAHAWCAGVAAELFDPNALDVYTGRVADLVAALSPLKPWDKNLELAREAAEQYADRITRPGMGADWVPKIGAMRSRREAAADALRGHGPGTGPKVGAFAANIRSAGRCADRATIDRHMLAIVDPHLQPTPKRVSDIEQGLIAATPPRYRPPEFQALLWGIHRYLKGYQTYEF